ncbi:hypothetical protein QO200_02530 [Flavobacterium sp. Arc3]|uniref:hypothetical protein n=1 Tax=Flavobacterium sp. Arc3 TaxID=3046686 RepID=UPI00352E5F46
MKRIILQNSLKTVIIETLHLLSLSEVEQYNAAWSMGVQVVSNIKDDIAINLYVINDSYCKMYYDMKTNKILYKQSFRKGARLDKYLDKIKIKKAFRYGSPFLFKQVILFVLVAIRISLFRNAM